MQGGSRREATSGFGGFRIVHERQRLFIAVERGLTMNEFGFWKCFFAVLLALLTSQLIGGLVAIGIAQNWFSW